MIKDIKYQVDAVKELVAKTRALLEEQGNRKKLVFKAPTGSGKTVMASKMLDDLTTELEQDGKEVAIIWIAPNKLHQQSYFRMKNYFSETRALSPVMYDELDHSHDGYIKPGEIFFVNWESINKDTNVMVRDTENSSSLYDLTRRTQEDHQLPIIVVIDEEHMFASSRNAVQSQKVLENIQPKLEIRISATPTTTDYDDIVLIRRSEVIQAQMIKNGITINPKLADVPEGLSENDYLLDRALARREEISKAYEALGVRINPLLLVQLPNDKSETLNVDETRLIEELKARLATEYDITADNGKLAVWLSNEKRNLDKLEESYNVAEVLLFKQAIALGWDCPRAAVLLIFREIQSTTFGIQTVGRILRMPEQKYYPNDLLNHGWVYTNLDGKKVGIQAEELNYITMPLNAKRRENLTNVTLPAEYSERLSADRNRIGSDFGKVLADTANERWFSNKIQMVFHFEGEEEKQDSAYDRKGYLPGMAAMLEPEIADNRAKAEALGIDFNVHRIQTQIPIDVDITGEEGETQFGQNKVIKYAKTQAELEWALTKFCNKLLTGYEKQCAASMRGHIITFMEEMLGVFETDVPVTILYHLNQPHFDELFRKTVEAYTKKVNERRAKAKSRSFKTYTWGVPEEREYNESTNQVVPSHLHALVPFIRLKTASNPEQDFETFLEANKEYIDWWYKNGESGKQDYAVGYTKAKTGERSLFYVDFVIRMKNGQVFLFDTKSQESDSEAPAKHNALLTYMNSETNAHLHLMGGVIIKNGENWYYSPLPIANTDDLSNWDAFHPNQYAK